ncbi:class I SAM-dependent DNA methyltransferase [Paenibacillus radicis (ex Xue et al. 2023)]|uniref:Class I SAM-dependent methyltransferase n=1 Tax=Paenibacillus radicis (ex Xue et al. 2023) TaxID=2972489 RepID=A0ABT1YFI1_9BACL|nr:class I SAM-dependent methyltransferase [Paenibacillus radicis (ex Xue et al. 2023)]MCR8631475.1 class I SAM-dependent methyltransferase [Paenibacillus radicis (ex Xue et al. 2023)]
MAYDLFAYHYDRLMEDMPYEEWLGFLSQCWDKHGQPRSIADLGCGTGSIAIPLAQQGYEVYGIDLSEDMLAVAQNKSLDAEQSLPFPGAGGVTWLQQDLRDWQLMRPVDAVISLCDCFNYLLEEDDVSQAFVQAYSGLKDEGVFVFDVHTPFQLKAYAQEQPFFLNEDDIAYIWTSELDLARCEIEHALTIFAKDNAAGAGSIDAVESNRFSRIDEYHVQRAYPLDWLKEQLLAAGFREVDCYADFLWKPVTETTQRAFFVARK